MEEQFSTFNQMKISRTAAYRIQITRQPIKRDNPVLPTCMMVCFVRHLKRMLATPDLDA
jgi:hypothetical protein